MTAGTCIAGCPEIEEHLVESHAVAQTFRIRVFLPAEARDSERLPVLDDAKSRRLVGWMSKRDLIGVYSQEILRKRQLLGHFVTSSDDEKRDVFVELPEGFERFGKSREGFAFSKGRKPTERE